MIPYMMREVGWDERSFLEAVDDDEEVDVDDGGGLYDRQSKKIGLSGTRRKSPILRNLLANGIRLAGVGGDRIT